MTSRDQLEESIRRAKKSLEEMQVLMADMAKEIKEATDDFFAITQTAKRSMGAEDNYAPVKMPLLSFRCVTSNKPLPKTYCISGDVKLLLTEDYIKRDIALFKGTILRYSIMILSIGSEPTEVELIDNYTKISPLVDIVLAQDVPTRYGKEVFMYSLPKGEIDDRLRVIGAEFKDEHFAIKKDLGYARTRQSNTESPSVTWKNGLG